MASDNNAGGGVFGALDSISGFLRTLLAVVVTGVVGAAGWVGYTTYNAADIAKKDLEATKVALAEKDQKLAVQEEKLTAQATEIATLKTDFAKLSDDHTKLQADYAALDQAFKESETKRALLKVDHRIAQITVLDQKTDPESGKVTQTTIEFVEQGPEGQSIGQKHTIPLKGDMVYVDYWVVKFDDEYVEKADLLRGTSICLFRRIFSSKQEPDDGYVLDKANSRPTAYSRGEAPSEFEDKIWRNFWDIANSPEKAKELGIREAHGDAVSVKLLPGKVYRLTLRASGGPSIPPPKPLEITPLPAAAEPMAE